LSTYVKANSFVSPVAEEKEVALATSKALGVLKDLDENAPKTNVLNRVARELRKTEGNETPDTFRILPQAAAEINRLPTNRVTDYLFHRYRYDVFPISRELDDFPPCLQIEPTSVCNFRCVFCYQTDKALTSKQNGHMGFIDLDLFKRVVDQAEGQVEIVTLASRGEPTLHPKFSDLMDYLRGKFLSLKINTNASRLTEEKCHAILQADVSTLVFSADAASEPLYSSMRVNGNLEQTLTNVETFRHIKEEGYPESRIVTRVSGVKYAAEQSLEEMEKTWGGLVDQVAFVSYNPWENSYERPQSDVTAPCTDLWRRMFVWWDGKVNPCDVDYLSLLEVGNSRNQSISELWKGSQYQSLRKKHLSKQRTRIEPCRRCSVI